MVFDRDLELVYIFVVSMDITVHVLQQGILVIFVTGFAKTQHVTRMRKSRNACF